MKIVDLPIEKLRIKTKLHSNKDIAAMNRLSDSIKMHNLMIPLLVSQEDSYYSVLDGNRRLKVWIALNISPTIPCIIVNHDFEMISSISSIGFEDIEPFSDDEKNKDILNIYISLAANIVRTKINHRYLKGLVRYLYEVTGMGYEKIAKRIGYSKSGVQKMLSKKDLNADPNPKSIVSLKRLRTCLKRLNGSISLTPDENKRFMSAIEVVIQYIDRAIGESIASSERKR